MEGCVRIWKDVKGCGVMWKDMEDYGMWQSDLEPSIVVLFIFVYTRMF